MKSRKKILKKEIFSLISEIYFKKNVLENILGKIIRIVNGAVALMSSANLYFVQHKD